MPDDPLIWALAIVVVGGVVVVALVFGGFVEVGIDPLRLSFRRRAERRDERISVLEEAEIEDAEVGDVTGLDQRIGGSTDTAGGASDVSVAKQVKIKGGKIGNISGVVVRGDTKGSESATQASDEQTTKN